MNRGTASRDPNTICGLCQGSIFPETSCGHASPSSVSVDQQYSFRIVSTRTRFREMPMPTTPAAFFAESTRSGILNPDSPNPNPCLCEFPRHNRIYRAERCMGIQKPLFVSLLTPSMIISVLSLFSEASTESLRSFAWSSRSQSHRMDAGYPTPGAP